MNILLKRTIFFLLIATISYAQEVSVTDAKGTIKTIRNNRVSVQTNGPNMPIERDIWINPSTSTTKIYTGTAWFQIGEGGGSSSSDPSVYTGSFTIRQPGGYQQSREKTVSVNNLPFEPSQITFVAHMNLPNLSRNNSSEYYGSNPNKKRLKNAVGTMHGFVREDSITLNKVQNVLFSGIHGKSPDDISLFSSNQHCIGLRYTGARGKNKGVIKAYLESFDANGNNFGFTLKARYERGVYNKNQAIYNEIFQQDVVVFYTAYK